VTASLGVATTQPDTPDAAALVDQADRALYFSKEAGRNRTSHYVQCSVVSGR
jgi:PleD family two-component response regulator